MQCLDLKVAGYLQTEQELLVKFGPKISHSTSSSVPVFFHSFSILSVYLSSVLYMLLQHGRVIFTIMYEMDRTHTLAHFFLERTCLLCNTSCVFLTFLKIL